MSGCCCDDNCAEGLIRRQRGTLIAVLGINAVMFAIIMAAALYGKSASLLSDSLDSLGDALTYSISLYVVAKGAVAKGRAALFKGSLIFLGACGVIAQIVVKLMTHTTPSYEIMGSFSLLSLAANSICLFLLWRHRNEDVNMSSVWECSRNDIATNLSIFVTAGAVWLTGSAWPDILVAAGLVVLLLRSAFRVIANALREMKKGTA
jgi:Co/Zn/Cd efflux system component